MKQKNMWSETYESFQSLYPNLKRKAIGYSPHGYMAILIYFQDGLRMVYDQVENRAKFITT